MFAFWRYTLSLIALAISLTLFVSLINSNITASNFTPNLPATDLSSIKIDTTIPKFLAQDFAQPIPNSPNSPNLPTTSTPISPLRTSSPTSSTTSPTALSSKPNKKTQNLVGDFIDIVDFNQTFLNCSTQAKHCRDIQCAFKDFSVTCNKEFECKYHFN
ncbi:27728_t:CDS:1 [Gigaspora margarita]|uniref:27728_t:CDS:1 n=1 Tax=Gigaspora margarita TaxID=4874 RepID=A0ABN7VS22_GIGMA|nr:27728_t:CDS:1 [Gigaspora margarita]